MSGPSPKERRALPEREAFPEVFFCFPPIDVPGFLSGTVSVVFDRSGRTGSMRGRSPKHQSAHMRKPMHVIPP